MERASSLSGTRDPDLYVSLGNYWLYRSRMLNPGSPFWEITWARASNNYRQARRLGISKSSREKMVKFIWELYPDVELVGRLLGR